MTSFGYPSVCLLCLGLLCLACLGCGSQQIDALTTFPATGTVHDASGKPVSGGSVEFQSKEDQNMLAVGDILPDGSFVLTTYANGVATEGAVLGEHQVTVHPLQIEHGGVEPIRIRRVHKIEAKDNTIPLKLPRR